jgi:hypothetical protein
MQRMKMSCPAKFMQRRSIAPFRLTCFEYREAKDWWPRSPIINCINKKSERQPNNFAGRFVYAQGRKGCSHKHI